MSKLSEAKKQEDKALICTITGNGGVGKTSLAATFPKPFFVLIEDGIKTIPFERRPISTPLISKVDELWEWLIALCNEKHDFKTVVFDSVTQMEKLFIQHVLDSDTSPKKPKGINQALGGYGNGTDAVATLHGRVRKAADILADKGINVVFIAHAETETLDLPDEEPYSRYQLRLGKKSVSPYVDNVDLVGFLKLEVFTTGDGEKKKAISDGTRLVVCHASASSVSKNRFGITEPLVFKEGENPFKHIINKGEKK